MRAVSPTEDEGIRENMAAKKPPAKKKMPPWLDDEKPAPKGKKAPAKKAPPKKGRY